MEGVSKRMEAGQATGWTEAITDPKTQKAISNLTKMSKALKGTAADSSSMASSLMAFGPLGIIFEAMAPLIEMFTPFLQIIVDSILPAMMPVLRPIMDVLVRLIPVFRIVGEIIGILMGIGLIPLIAILEIFFAIIEPFLPILELFAEVLGWVLELIDPMVEGIQWFFETLFGWIQVLLDSITDVPTVIGEGIEWGLGQIGFPGFDDGGRMLQSGMAHMKANEIAVTGNQLGGLTDEIIELKVITQAGIEEKEFRKKFE